MNGIDHAVLAARLLEDGTLENNDSDDLNSPKDLQYEVGDLQAFLIQVIQTGKLSDYSLHYHDHEAIRTFNDRQYTYRMQNDLLTLRITQDSDFNSIYCEFGKILL